MKMNREHTIPLTSHVNSTIKIEEQFKPPYSEYLFPSHIDLKKHINTEIVNKALRRIGYQNRLLAHGFRALASTTLNEQGFDPDIIESALAHVDKNAVRKAYNRAEYIEHRTKVNELVVRVYCKGLIYCK
jgi:integrase